MSNVRVKPIIGAGGGKGGSASSRVAQEAPDSLRSKAYARVVDLVCEGEIEGLTNGLQSVYLDETPIQNSDGSTNFSGVALETREGTQQQSYIPGFASVENEVAVGIECKFDQPIVRTINDPDVDAVRIKIGIPTLTEQNTSNGDLNGASVEYAIDVQANGAGFVEKVRDTVSGKTTTRYQRSYYVPLSGSGPWDVRLRRITVDSTQTALQNKTWLESYTEVVESKLRYPNSALMALRVDASQFQSIPKRSYDLKLLRIRVPSNYDSKTRTYSGIWDGSFKIAWSDNPAWCFYDLVTSERYGLGSFIAQSQVDKWALYRIAQYCDELVPDGLNGVEPRFTCNVYMQTREQAYKVVQDIASVFRGMAYWASGAITLTQDAPRDAVYQFTAANVVDGEFAYQGSSAKARHTVALVSWNDPDDFYRQKVEYVEDAEGIARYGVVQADVVAVGCTSRGQAHRVGKWLLYSEQSESEIVTFRTGLEGAVVRPGDVIQVADSGRAGVRLGGRIIAADQLSITLDHPVQANALGTNWMLSVVLSDGSIEQRAVQSIDGAQVVVVQGFTSTLEAGSIWILTASNVQTQLLRVVQVAESEPGLHEITALAHNPVKYDAIERGLALQPRAITVLSDVPLAPTDLTFVESLYRVKDQAQVLVQLSWSEVQTAVAYRVSYRLQGGNFESLPTSSANYIEIRNAREGEYEFQVRAIGVTRKESPAATLSATVFGKTLPPANVSGFTIQRRITDLLLSWNEVTDADLAGYEVRVGSGWDDAQLVATTAATQLVHDQSESGLYIYLIRSFDTSGNYSSGVSTFELNLKAPASVRQFDVVQSANRLEFRWIPNTEPEVVGYELREGSAWETSVFVAQVASSSYGMPAGFDGERMFWIKAIASPGVYSAVAAWVSTAVAVVQSANLILQRDEAATGFSGTRHFMEEVTIGTETALRMRSGVSTGEYLFEVDLNDTVRAQNSLLAALGATADDRTLWSQAAFTWASNDAVRQWSADGSTASISARFQISKYRGVMNQGEIAAWALNGQLTSLGASTLTQSHDITFGTGRYGDGAHIADTSTLAWNVNIPAVFNTTFWFVPDQVTTSVIWRAAGAAGSGIELRVVYDHVRGELLLEDHLFRRVVVPLTFAAGDFLCVGVCQTEAERRLFVGGMNHAVVGAREPLVPVGPYTSVQLH
jgi:predicted phage tail protein